MLEVDIENVGFLMRIDLFKENATLCLFVRILDDVRSFPKKIIIARKPSDVVVGGDFLSVSCIPRTCSKGTPR